MSTVDDASQMERLRRIEAVTDTALAHLDVPDLLSELLGRVRELLAADTAAVLLLDERSRELVATAASGIEEEVRQGIRIPLGEGFAGRIAEQAEPIVITDVDHGKVRNPMLRERGIRSLLGVPLIAEGRVIGVMHVGSLTKREFGSDDVELLQLVADRVALAVDARLSDVERAAAAALQRSLVPGRLPRITGLDVASRYLPGDEGGVGGDWYDLFALSRGYVGVVIGDVVGRGLSAAVVMGRLRSALRAYALETNDPSEVIARLDRKLQHFEAGQLTTVLYGVLDPNLDTITLSSAGHPLPVVFEPGSEPRWLEGPVGPPLGVTGAAQRPNIVVDLRPGTMLSLFTDGLVERRGEPLDQGVKRLAASLEVDSAQRSCSAAIATLVGVQDRPDDVAVLVMRREGADHGALEIKVAAARSSVGPVRSSLRRWLNHRQIGDDDSQRILLAAGEATANAIEHAHGPAQGEVTFSAEMCDGTVEVIVRDQGRWRPPRGVDRGRGLLIMERCADSVDIDKAKGGTTVTLRFLTCS